MQSIVNTLTLHNVHTTQTNDSAIPEEVTCLVPRIVHTAVYSGSEIFLWIHLVAEDLSCSAQITGLTQTKGK